MTSPWLVNFSELLLETFFFSLIRARCKISAFYLSKNVRLHNELYIW